METFCLPLSELRERFTWSEQVLMGWRSQEQSVQMKRRMKRKPEKSPYVDFERAPARGDGGTVPEGLPDRFRDEEGQVNLSKVKLADAAKYMTSLGFFMPVGGGASRG